MSDEESEYEIEKILDKRRKGGKIKYLVKWQGYPISEASWVDEKDLAAPKLLKEFEKSKGDKKRKKDTDSLKDKPKSKIKNLQQIFNGFLQGYTAQEVLGVRMIEGELYFALKWYEMDRETYVPAKIVNKVVPHKVISYYESNLKFEDEKQNAEFRNS